jgi:hypothetical protein
MAQRRFTIRQSQGSAVMLLLALATLLAVQDAPPPPDTNVVDPLVIEGRKIPTDHEIATQLNDLLKREPDRKICFQRTPTGSRIPRVQCNTLAGWYKFQEDVGAREGPPETTPPTELVAAIQSQYVRKAAQLRALRETQSATP